MINSLPIRYNYNKCEAHIALTFINALKNDKRLALKSALPSTEKCHFERYNFLLDKNKIVIVYDIKANIFSVTAKQQVLDFVKAILQKSAPAQHIIDLPKSKTEVITLKPSTTQAVTPLKPSTTQAVKPLKPSTTQAVTPLKPSTTQAVKPLKPSTTQVASQVNLANNATQNNVTQNNATQKNAQTNTLVAKSLTPASVTATATQDKKTILPIEKKTSSTKKTAKKAIKPIITTTLETTKNVEPKQDVKVEAKTEQTDVLPEYKNGFSIKKCPLEALESIIKRVKALNGITVKAERSTLVGTPQETKTFELTDKNKQILYLRYMPQKQSLQLQGKRSNMFGEVQVILSRDSGYLEAVGSHIELTGEEKRAGEIQRDLKKLIPDAFAYLSEQSKIDLSIGMIDIGNQDVKLSDYSVLLVPPYRGLERFIYDLQCAQGITVKMIGQAYEKNDAGQYLLKLGYRKKITGVVYNEVMSALYTEYFEKRNFYAHSDNSLDSQVRRIDDKAVAKVIFDHLCEIINYNSKKLKEIGFAIQE